MMSRVVVQCRKCESVFAIPFAVTEDAVNLAERLKGLLDKDCPECGEEPYQNWMLYDVLYGKENEANAKVQQS